MAAIVKYEPDTEKNQQSISDENIDERILRLLGLEDVFDIDYDTYMTLLREAIAKGSFGDNKLPDEELAVLANERKRVRSKTGRFKIKNKKVKVEIQKEPSGPSKVVDPSKLLPAGKTSEISPSEERKEKKERESEDSIFNSIFGSLDNIFSILKESFKKDRKAKSKLDDERELEKRQKSEDKLEGFKKFIKKTSTAVLAPAVNILKKIIDGVKLVIVGWTLNTLLDWLKDPKNKEDVTAVAEFLQRNMGKLFALYVFLQAKPFLGILIKLGAVILKGAIKLVAALGGAILRLAARNPLAAGGALLAVGGVIGVQKIMEANQKAPPGLTSDAGDEGTIGDALGSRDPVTTTESETPEKITPETPKPAQTESPAPVETPAPAPVSKTPYERATEAGYEVVAANDGNILYQKDGQTRTKTGTFRVQGATIEERFNDYFSTLRDRVGRREGERGFDSSTAKFPTLKLNVGGVVPDARMIPAPMGTDTVPAMLTPGETVLQVGARERMMNTIGVDPLAFNVGPNANKPKVRGGIQGYQDGGQVGNKNRQIYLHWTAGGYNHRSGPYHSTIQGDGSIYKHTGGDYDVRTGHTYGRNTNNVGLSVASMGGVPWKTYPPKDIQIDSMMKEAAKIALSWGWKPGDVSIKNVMTHAEAGSNKDGKVMHDNYGPVMWGGNGERWDWLQLKETDTPGSGGDKLRQKMKKFMGDPNALEIPEAAGAPSGGDFIPPETGSPAAPSANTLMSSSPSSSNQSSQGGGQSVSVVGEGGQQEIPAQGNDSPNVSSVDGSNISIIACKAIYGVVG